MATATDEREARAAAEQAAEASSRRRGCSARPIRSRSGGRSRGSAPASCVTRSMPARVAALCERAGRGRLRHGRTRTGRRLRGALLTGPQGPPVRRPRVAGEPGVLRPAGLPAWSSSPGPGRRRRPRTARGPQGGVRDARRSSTRSRRPTSCQQPGRAQAGVRDRRRSLLARGAQLPRRPAHNGGLPRQVDRSRLQGRREPGRHPGQGRVPQRPDGADPVRAADRDRCTRSRCCSARRGSTSTTSWTWRPGRSFVEWAVAARAHRVRDQLPQPGRVDARRRAWTTTCSTGPRDRARRHRARSPARRKVEHRRPVPRRHADRDAARLPGRRRATTGSARPRCSTR